jgi:hypothetical protein
VAKVSLTLELNDQDPYEAQAIKILREAHEASRKEMIVSGLLYWVRSPTFSLSDRIDKLLLALQANPGQPLPQPTQVQNHQPQSKPKHVEQHHKVAPVQTQQELSSDQIVSKDVPEAFLDGADDAFNSLFDQTS